MVDINANQFRINNEIKYFDYTEESLECRECKISFELREHLYDHLILHHIKQPIISLKRYQLLPIKLTIKSTKNKGFRVVPSPDLEQLRQSTDFDNHNSNTSIDNGHPTSEENECSGLHSADAELNSYIVETRELRVPEEAIDTDETVSNTEETTEAEIITPDDYGMNKGVIPGGEPTPPPDTPELPKIRIKTNLLQATYADSANQHNHQLHPHATDAIIEEVHTPGSIALAANNDILTNLFANNDRAKDLGFTTIDPDFTSADLSNAIQPYSSAAASVINSNPLANLRSLPMQELAQQVSRLQPSNNSLHQQNVLINIQQFPQHTVPVAHTYTPQMYQQPQPPMYQHIAPMHQQQPIQYQYVPQNTVYYQQPAPPPAYIPPQMQQMQPQQQQHMPAPPMPRMQPPPPPPPPNNQMRMHPPQHHQQQRPPPPPRQSHPHGQRHPPPGYPRQQQPRHALQTGNQPRRMPPPGQMKRHILPKPNHPNQGPRQRMPLLQQQLTSPAGNARQTKASTPDQVKRATNANAQCLNVKKARMETFPGVRNEDADCQLVAVTHKQSGMPEIQSIQGNVTVNEPNNLHISDAITLSVKTPSPKPKETRSEAKEVANVLAARGITVTTSAKPKETSSEPVSINLNSCVSITPNPGKKKDDVTVDLTDELLTEEARKSVPQVASAMKPPPPLASLKNGPFECHLCPAKFPSTALMTKHRKLYHRTNCGPEFGIPLIDLKSPGVTQRLVNFGIYHYIPLPNSNSSGMFALPLLSVNNINTNKMGNTQELASSILTLGPIKPITPPRPIVRKGKPANS